MVMGFGRSFSQGGRSLCPKAFFQGANSDEISFYQLETQRKTFFTEIVIRNCQVSKSRGLSLCTPFRHSWSWLTELRNPKCKPTPLFERCFTENSKTRRRDWKQFQELSGEQSFNKILWRLTITVFSKRSYFLTEVCHQIFSPNFPILEIFRK